MTDRLRTDNVPQPGRLTVSELMRLLHSLRDDRTFFVHDEATAEHIEGACKFIGARIKVKVHSSVPLGQMVIVSDEWLNTDVAAIAAQAWSGPEADPIGDVRKYADELRERYLRGES